MINANIRCSLIATVSLISLYSCAPLQDYMMGVIDKPVRTMPSQPIYKDEGYYQEAVRAINSGDYARALDDLQAARQVQANDVRVLNAFGVVYDKLGRFDLSARFYAQALAVNPASPIVAKNLAYSAVLQNMASGQQNGPEIVATAPLPAATQVAPSLPTPAVVRDTRAPGQPTQTKVAVAAVPVMAASQLPVAIHTALRSQSVEMVQSAAKSERLPQAGKALVPTQISTTVIAHTKLAFGLTGHPLSIANATGRGEMAEPVRRRLVQLGWSAPHWAATDIPNEQITTIFYAERNAAVAHALARTLPFPVHLAICADRCKGIVLTVGTNILSWKPAFAKLTRWTS